MAEIIEFTGTVLTGPGTERHGLWSVGGRLTFRRPAKAPDRILAGFVLPGFVDAHCHIGLGAGGPVDALTAEEQARTDLDAGTLLVRDAGSPADTRWLQGKNDVPVLIRAGRQRTRARAAQCPARSAPSP